MKREFAKPIAEALGALLLVVLALAAWIFNLRVNDLPGWVLLVVNVSAAAMIIYAAIKATNRIT